MKEDKEKCLEAGCSHYASKPIAIDTLLATVAEALGGNDHPGDVAASAMPSEDGLQPLVSSLPTEEPVFREIVREFVEYLGQLLTDMRQAAAKKDIDRLAEMAHSLKGSAGTAGFDAFTEPARRLETLVKRRRLDAIGPIIDELSQLADSIHIPTETDGASL
jgi:HPt (histidine-containing phosphotransfer) domain-containing protein